MMVASHVAYKRGPTLLSFSWNAAYEATPGSGLSRNSLDDELRRITSGVRERMELSGFAVCEVASVRCPGEQLVVLSARMRS